MRRFHLFALFVFILALLVGWWNLGRKPGNRKDQPPQSSQPNIVLIYADDIDCESVFTQWPGQNNELIRFPVLQEIAKSGTTFTNFHVTTPVCGPSRACLLSGQYAHRNQIRVNTSGVRSANGFSGGYQYFDRDHELGIWMKQAGYSTAWVGKYLHDGFHPDAEKQETWREVKPQGWDRVECSLGGRYFKFGVANCVDPGVQEYSGEYRTDVEANSAATIVDEHFNSGEIKPLFLVWGPYAAHLSQNPKAMAARRHMDMYADEIPSGVTHADRYREIEGQPAEMAAIPPYAESAMGDWKEIHRSRLQAMKALDEGLGKIRDRLRKNGQLQNTLFVFTSDHGYSLGQHRHFGKRFAYDRITRVPFIVSGPRVLANRYCNELLANIDIAPTLVELAGSSAPESVDGISFANLFYDPDARTPVKRDAILIENWDRIYANGVMVDATFASLRTRTHLYTEWATGGFEYYDIAADPEQTANLYPTLDQSTKKSLGNQLHSAHVTNQPPVFSRLFRVPEEYVDHPISGSFKPVPFSGFVEDDAGVSSVQLELYCPRIDRYWDGTRWSEQPVKLDAVLSMPGGRVTQWTYTLDTSGIAFRDDERMNRRDTTIKLVATDAQGTQSTWNDAYSFRMKITDPETWFEKPAPWTDKTTPLKLRGQVADNQELACVKLLVVDLDNDRFWDAGNRKWVEERTMFDVPMTLDEHNSKPGQWGTWSYSLDAPQHGKIFICARAYDTTGNFDFSTPFHIIPLDPTQDDQE